jgi:hypothetical protein
MEPINADLSRNQAAATSRRSEISERLEATQQPPAQTRQNPKHAAFSQTDIPAEMIPHVWDIRSTLSFTLCRLATQQLPVKTVASPREVKGIVYRGAANN